MHDDKRMAYLLGIMRGTIAKLTNEISDEKKKLLEPEIKYIDALLTKLFYYNNSLDITEIDFNEGSS